MDKDTELDYLLQQAEQALAQGAELRKLGRSIRRLERIRVVLLSIAVFCALCGFAIAYAKVF